MSTDGDDRRLMDDPGESAELRSMLAAGATDDPAYDFERGLAAHLAAVAAPVAAAAGGAAAAKGVAALGTKAWLAIASGSILAASVAAIVWNSAPDAKNPGPVAVPAAVGGAPLAATEPVETPSSPVAPVAVAPAPAPAAPRSSAEPRPFSRPSASSSGVAAAEITLPESPSPSVAAEVPAESERARPSAPIAAAPTPSSVESEAFAAERTAREAERREATRQSQNAESDRVSREMEALVEAKHALRSDPARALELARAGERDFPHGMLVEERQHILILALIQLGRLDEAKRRAAPYLEKHPDSPFSRRVRRALEAAGATR
ncbi:MAG TPA: hypothetical protein VHE30_29185 [Polyangiaceae bacterium]|nr:hypothetical protein [Polyangiaceae bacterium]